MIFPLCMPLMRLCCANWIVQNVNTIISMSWCRRYYDARLSDQQMALLQYQRENLHFLSEEVWTIWSIHLLLIIYTLTDTDSVEIPLLVTCINSYPSIFGLADSPIARVFKQIWTNWWPEHTTGNNEHILTISLLVFFTTSCEFINSLMFMSHNKHELWSYPFRILNMVFSEEKRIRKTGNMQ